MESQKQSPAIQEEELTTDCCWMQYANMKVAKQLYRIYVLGVTIGRVSAEAANRRSLKSFETTDELRTAIVMYLSDNSTNTKVARTYGWPIGVWNVSQIEDFSYAFSVEVPPSKRRTGTTAGTDPRKNVTAFNEDLSGWDTGNAKTMYYMFFGASSFNGDISTWDVSNVTNMASMFSNAHLFDQDLSQWNVSSVKEMDRMFLNAWSFNQTLASWNVSSCVRMDLLFMQATAFNQDISNWDVSNVNNMRGMFAGADSFNQDISPWDVSGVGNMMDMFNGATSFNQDISSWDVRRVRSLRGMFAGATAFNQTQVCDWQGRLPRFKQVDRGFFDNCPHRQGPTWAASFLFKVVLVVLLAIVLVVRCLPSCVSSRASRIATTRRHVYSPVGIELPMSRS